MAIKKFVILDFDLTVTPYHTFSIYCKDKWESDDFGDIGNNIKEGLNMEHDESNGIAIATFHNNPEYVKATIEKALNKKLSLTQTHGDTTGNHAVNEYQVEGTSTPFYISYIPHTGANYQAALKVLSKTGKNSQIQCLLKLAEDKALLDPDACIEFYDDSNDNFKKAQELTTPNLSCYWVNGKDSSFATLETWASTCVSDDSSNEFTDGESSFESSNDDKITNDSPGEESLKEAIVDKGVNVGSTHSLKPQSPIGKKKEKIPSFFEKLKKTDPQTQKEITSAIESVKGI